MPSQTVMEHAFSLFDFARDNFNMFVWWYKGPIGIGGKTILVGSNCTTFVGSPQMATWYHSHTTIIDSSIFQTYHCANLIGWLNARQVREVMMPIR